MLEWVICTPGNGLHVIDARYSGEEIFVCFVVGDNVGLSVVSRGENNYINTSTSVIYIVISHLQLVIHLHLKFLLNICWLMLFSS